MQGLSFRNDQDFEEICCYLMTDLVRQKMGLDLQFRRYGGSGQKQYGIDIVPTSEGYAIYGQSKLVSKLNWSDIANELEKTNKFQYSIDKYVIFTTAHRHTSINDRQIEGEMWHIRTDGNRFSIEVVYWDEIKSIDSVPQEVQRQIFPRAFQITANEQKLDLASITALKRIVPTYFHSDFLLWLETWDFSQGWIQMKHFESVDHLYIEHDRTKQGIMYKNTDMLYVSGRVDLAEAIPAGEEFFDALSHFRNIIRMYTIRQTAYYDQQYLTLQGLQDSNATDFLKITNQWTVAAQNLAEIYRVKILGEMSQ